MVHAARVTPYRGYGVSCAREAIAKEVVNISVLLIRIKGQRKLFQICIKIITPNTLRPGTITGSTTDQYIRNSEKPSTRAACKRSSGIAPLIYCRIKNMPSGGIVLGRIKAQ